MTKTMQLSLISLLLSAVVYYPLQAKGENTGICLSLKYEDTVEEIINELGVERVRCEIGWKYFESNEPEGEEHNYNWNARAIKRVERQIDHGRKVVLAIRTNSNHWAVADIGSDTASWVPKDLTDAYDSSYGHSKSYYHFVRTLASAYPNDIDVVIIENEVNSPRFWGHDDIQKSHEDMDAYYKLFLTARKAVKDIDPDMKVTGNISSRIMGCFMTQELLETEGLDEAYDFYMSYFSKTKEDIMKNDGSYIVPEDLEAKLAEKELGINRAQYLIDDLGLYKTVDIVDFHYYEPFAHLPDVLLFLRSKNNNSPIMSSEMGSRQIRTENSGDGTFGETERRLAAEDLGEKLTSPFNIKWIIWYPHSGGTPAQYGPVGLIDKNGTRHEEVINAFADALAIQKRRPASVKNLVVVVN